MLLRVTRLVLVACVFTACHACARNTATFVLTNDAAQAILSATVAISGETAELREIGPGGRATGTLPISGDAAYHVTVRFQSGKVLERRLGYVTSGMNFRDEFSVTDTDIVLTKAEVSNP